MAAVWVGAAVLGKALPGASDLRRKRQLVSAFLLRHSRSFGGMDRQTLRD